MEAADDHLYNNIVYSKKKIKEHVVNSVLPRSVQPVYELRPGRHKRSLITKVNSANESDFVFCVQRYVLGFLH